MELFGGRLRARRYVVTDRGVTSRVTSARFSTAGQALPLAWSMFLDLQYLKPEDLDRHGHIGGRTTRWSGWSLDVERRLGVRQSSCTGV